MSDDTARYIELRQEAARHMAAREYREAQIALNVAQQFHRGMSPAERQKAVRALQIPD